MRMRVELSEESLGAAVAGLSAYGKSLEARCDELCARLAGIGVDVAKAVVRKDTGELESGIRVEELEDGGGRLVVSEGDYAMFVEFGTGVVGQGTYPAQLPEGYEYDQRRTPAAHDQRDPTKWYYRDRDGRIRGTRGQTANAYMAEAAEAMRDAVLRTAREVFRR